MAAKPRSADADSKKRRRKRKARTEVSPSPSESSDSSQDGDTGPRKSANVVEDIAPAAVAPPAEGANKQRKKSKKAKEASLMPDPEPKPSAAVAAETAETEARIETASPLPEDQRKQHQENFSSFYLRRVTAELADDLDKVRQAGDFKASTSLPMLIHALQQGEGIFSAEERRRVCGTGAAGAVG